MAGGGSGGRHLDSGLGVSGDKAHARVRRGDALAQRARLGERREGDGARELVLERDDELVQRGVDFATEKEREGGREHPRQPGTE